MAKSKTSKVKFSARRTVGAKTKSVKSSKSIASKGSKSNAWRSYVGVSNDPIPF